MGERRMGHTPLRQFTERGSCMNEPITIEMTPEQAKVLLALLDNSVVSPKAVSKDVYLGLIAVRDQLMWDIGTAIFVDTNDPRQMGVLYRQVEQMFAAPKKTVEVTV
jgi:hypothetical protein